MSPLLTQSGHGEKRNLCRYWGQSGHDLLRCICLLLTQSGQRVSGHTTAAKLLTMNGRHRTKRGLA